MLARFVSSVFLVFVQKTKFSVLYLKRAHESQGNIYVVPKENINFDIYQNINSDINQNILFFKPHHFENFNKSSSFQNLQQYIIARQPRLMELAELTNLKKNRKRLENTIDPSSAPSTPSSSYVKLK